MKNMVCIFKKLLEDLETLLNIIYLKAKKKLFFFLGFVGVSPFLVTQKKASRTRQV